jgi:RNA polymerase sigma-70 factor (ECF subfamily)
VPEGHDPASKRTPHDNLERSAFFESLDRALEALPLDQRTAFVLAEFVGLPGEAIARIEGVPVGTVRSRLSRAKAKLREGLREYAGGDT